MAKQGHGRGDQLPILHLGAARIDLEASDLFVTVAPDPGACAGTRHWRQRGDLRARSRDSDALTSDKQDSEGMIWSRLSAKAYRRYFVSSFRIACNSRRRFAVVFG